MDISDIVTSLNQYQYFPQHNEVNIPMLRVVCSASHRCMSCRAKLTFSAELARPLKSPLFATLISGFQDLDRPKDKAYCLLVFVFPFLPVSSGVVGRVSYNNKPVRANKQLHGETNSSRGSSLLPSPCPPEKSTDEARKRLDIIFAPPSTHLAARATDKPKPAGVPDPTQWEAKESQSWQYIF